MRKKINKTESEVQVFAGFVHGALFGLHALWVVYNIKRKNWQSAAIHLSVGLWDGLATWSHIKAAKEVGTEDK